jgi:hypothetical protein
MTNFQVAKKTVGFSPMRGFCGLLQDQTHREFVNGPFQFNKRSQDFIGTHNETFSVAMRVNNPDRAGN